MKRWLLILSLITVPLFAYGFSQSMIPMSDLMNSSLKYGAKDEKALLEMQTMFIKNVFTDNMIKTQSVIFDEDDEAFANMKAQNEMMNDLLAYEMAKELAKQDIMNLKPIFKDRGWIR